MRKYGGHLVDDGDDFGTVDDLSFQSAAVEGDDGGGHGVSLAPLFQNKNMVLIVGGGHLIKRG